MDSTFEQFQLDLTKQVLEVLEDTEFVLAGAGAMKAHGIISRPTYDIDLFTRSPANQHAVRDAAARVIAAVSAAGSEIQTVRSSDSFVRLEVVEGTHRLEIDFAVNWRADPPTQLHVGPVLSASDAVAGKLSAVYSRGEIRDFFDLDSIRSSGRYSDDELLALGRKHDTGFDPRMFAEQLARIRHLEPSAAEQYGFDSQSFKEMEQRTLTWAIELYEIPAPLSPPPPTQYPHTPGPSI